MSISFQLSLNVGVSSFRSDIVSIDRKIPIDFPPQILTLRQFAAGKHKAGYSQQLSRDDGALQQRNPNGTIYTDVIISPFEPSSNLLLC